MTKLPEKPVDTAGVVIEWGKRPPETPKDKMRRNLNGKDAYDAGLRFGQEMRSKHGADAAQRWIKTVGTPADDYDRGFRDGLIS